MTRKTIYIVDDNPEFRQSTAWWLQGSGYHVEIFESPSVALEQLPGVSATQQACILMDVRMPEMSGLDLHDKLKSRAIQLPIIYMTGHADITLAVEAMKKGAITYLEKPLDRNALCSALDSAFTRAASLARDTEKKPDNDSAEEPPEVKRAKAAYRQRYNSLTPREVEVLEGIVEGKMNKVLAFDLGISVKTIEIHRAQVKRKMQAKTAADLIKMVLTEQAF